MTPRPLCVSRSETENPMRHILTLVGMLLAVPAAAQSTQADSVTPLATTAVSSGVVASVRPIHAYRLAMTSGASAGYFMVFNSATIPADGVVTPLFCRAVAANSSISMVFPGSPARFSTGLSLAFSTTGCYAKAASSTAFFEYSVK